MDQAKEDKFSQKNKLLRYCATTCGIQDPKIMHALNKVPRQLFIPHQYRVNAYKDTPFPIGYDQTTSQPSLIAKMLQLLHLTGNQRVLEIGTGSGYQTALLAELSKEVWTIERIAPLAKKAQKVLNILGYKHIHSIIADGTLGLPQHAPYDRILVSAAAKTIPNPLKDQLSEMGIIVIPIKATGLWQQLSTLTKEEGKYVLKNHYPVRFVPLISD